MLRNKTVFVVGAGASKEFDLPLGYDLGLQIQRALDIKFEMGNRLVSGDGQIYTWLQRHVQQLGERDVNPWLYACWRICEAIPHHNSIDNLIDNYAGEEKVELCGKLGIAKLMLVAEQKSKLWANP